MDLEGLNETAIAAAAKLGVDDAVALTVSGKDRMIRFANNSATVAKRIEESELMVYLAKGRRRAIASTMNMEESSVKKFVGDLFASLGGQSEGEYVPLPKKALRFRPKAGLQDRKLLDAGEELPAIAERAISSSLKAGGRRSAGVVEASYVTWGILTTTGTRGTDARASITLNIRSFAGNDASGHGLSCSSTLAGLDPEEAGRRAGHDAKMMAEASEPEPGKYEVLLSPAVASNLVGEIASSASAFAVDAGVSYLADKIGNRVASKSFSLTDHGAVKGGLGGRAFDDEGVPTRSTKIVDHGKLKGYLHNLTTARKWKTETTGNAGLVSPRAWNLEVGAGDSSYEEMAKEIRRGIVLTSNWYTRFKNHRTGEFSTVPRDGAYLIEGGRVVKPLKGMRLSDDLQRIFSSVKMLSRQREWIEWWEVETPTLCPWILTEGVTITRAYE